MFGHGAAIKLISVFVSAMLCMVHQLTKTDFQMRELFCTTWGGKSQRTVIFSENILNNTYTN